MPLLDFSREKLYLRRDRLWVDSNEREPGSRSLHDVNLELPRQFENVQALNLVQHNIPTDMLPTFTEPAGGLRGNNKLDVRIEVAAAPSTFVEYTVSLNTEKTYLTMAALATDVEDALNDGLAAAGHGTINAGNGYVWSITTTSFVYFSPTVQSESGLFKFTMISAANAYFLFGSGPSTGDGPELVLGFEEGVDTIIPTQGSRGIYSSFTNEPYPVSYKMVSLRPFRFVDVYVDEISANDPVARILAPPGQFRYTKCLVPFSSLLTDPVRRLTQMRVRLLLDGKRVPNPASTDGWDLVFDVISLARLQEIPSWMRQTIMI